MVCLSRYSGTQRVQVGRNVKRDACPRAFVAMFGNKFIWELRLPKPFVTDNLSTQATDKRRHTNLTPFPFRDNCSWQRFLASDIGIRVLASELGHAFAIGIRGIRVLASELGHAFAIGTRGIRVWHPSLGHWHLLIFPTTCLW